MDCVIFFSSSFFFNSGVFSTMIEKFRIIVLSPTQITQMSVYEISLTEKDEPMLMTMRFCIVIVLCMCYVYEVFAQQCKEDEHAISGMMLRGHTFRTMRSSIAFECHQACYNDFRCQKFSGTFTPPCCFYVGNLWFQWFGNTFAFRLMRVHRENEVWGWEWIFWGEHAQGLFSISF